MGLVLLVAGALAGWFVYVRYMPSNELADKSKLFGIKSGQVAVVLNNELQETKGIYEDGQVYLPVSWVNEQLNQRFYWDEGEALLVYTLPDSIVYADASTCLLYTSQPGRPLNLQWQSDFLEILERFLVDKMCIRDRDSACVRDGPQVGETHFDLLSLFVV